ncbi:MAG TPA: lysozyme [Bryobacteraceae bacterium]|nr:lysozyme [Bryobacteraceae bacterium]
MAERRASPAALDLIKRFESLRLEAYLCPAQVWTIGWGHTAGVKPGDSITSARAEELLEADVAQVEADLPKVVHAPLTQGQWDALVSLCFNLRGGSLGLARLAPRLVAKINAGDTAGAAAELLDINHAGGQVVPGLTRRREAEREVFLG